MKKYLIEFQKYEIDNVLTSLRNEIQRELREHCKFEYQEETGNWYYTSNRKVKQLEFTIHSILRQHAAQLVTNETA